MSRLTLVAGPFSIRETSTHPAVAPAIEALSVLGAYEPTDAHDLEHLLRSLHHHSDNGLTSALMRALRELADTAEAVPGVSPLKAANVAGHLRTAVREVDGMPDDQLALAHLEAVEAAQGAIR